MKALINCTVGAVTGQLAATQRVVRFPHGATLYVIHKLLFRVWASCICELVYLFAPITQKILVWGYV
ncbi:hypothetical protein SFRURICE_016701 [Spodoptera frugiperda]|nr:hypothetical protein SFRURICE_016701 [Spodoptera frugiperda]